MNTGYIGIDIGKKGGIAYNDGSKITTYTMPLIKDEVDYAFLYDIIQNIVLSHISKHKSSPHIVFEKLNVIYGSSKSTAFSMGYQCGAVELICISLGCPYTKIPAKTWQKDIFLGVEEIQDSKGKRDTKAMALIAAKRLFPDQNFKASDRSKKDHDGIIDALLISEYAKRKGL